MINKEIHYSCFLTNCGYSQAARDYIKSLLKLGHEVEISTFSKFPTKHLDKIDVDLFRQLKSNRFGDDMVQILHCIPDRQNSVRRLKKTIGFATFETFDPPKYWFDILSKNDAVVCPSTFCVDLFKDKVSSPVIYLPHCIDVNIFNPNIAFTPNKKFTFLFFASWRERKGWRELIEAWSLAFNKKDEVQLVIKTDKTELAKQEVEKLIREVSNNQDVADIVFIDKDLKDSELPSFYKSMDCLVFPTKGEGFGLPILQAMAVGTPVIAPAITGCKDLVNKDNATELNVEGFLAYQCIDMIPQFKNKKWAYIKAKEIADKMREVYKNVDIAKRKAEKALSFIQDYSYEKVGITFDGILKRMY